MMNTRLQIDYKISQFVILTTYFFHNMGARESIVMHNMTNIVVNEVKLKENQDKFTFTIYPNYITLVNCHDGAGSYRTIEQNGLVLYDQIITEAVRGAIKQELARHKIDAEFYIEHFHRQDIGMIPLIIKKHVLVAKILK